MITISSNRFYGDPDVLILRDGGIATPADFLPVPGVALQDSIIREAIWHGPQGRYRLAIDQARTSLSLEDAAAMLETFLTPAVPAPPATGNGVLQRGRSSPPDKGALLIFDFALSASVALVALSCSRRLH